MVMRGRQAIHTCGLALGGRRLGLARRARGGRENFGTAVPLDEARVAALATAVHDASRVVACNAVGAALVASESMLFERASGVSVGALH